MHAWVDNFRQLEWAGKEYAWLGWIILALALWGPWRALRGAAWNLPQGMPGQKRIRPSLWSRLAWLPGTLRIFGLVLCWLALMRPQTVSFDHKSSVQALDIFLCLDISGSMMADDIKPNRLAAAKQTLQNFVRGLKGDRVGLAVFKAKAFIQCPLSLDHAIVDYFIGQVDFDTIRVDGTAVGDGLLAAVSRLIKEPGRNQVVILATDGVNNAGGDPQAAARLAAAAGIKVYTIGIGRKGGADIIYTDPFGRQFKQHLEEPDEAALTKMATVTGGQYFRAIDENALSSVYRRIAELERHEVKVRTWRNATEHYFFFLLWGAALLALEALLRLRIRVLA